MAAAVAATTAAAAASAIGQRRLPLGRARTRRPGSRVREAPARPRGRRPSEASGASHGFATEGGGGLREEAEEERGKMAAVELEWIPETLYNTAISAVVDNYIRSRRDIRSLPENIQFDVYYKVQPICSIGPGRCRRRSRAAPPSTSTARSVASTEVAAFRYPATRHPRVCLPVCAARGGSCASATRHPLRAPRIGLRECLAQPSPTRSSCRWGIFCPVL